MSYYIGTTPKDVLDGFVKRFFYALRRNEDGELFLIVADQLNASTDQDVVINEVGVADGNCLDYEEGIDFLEGLDANHDKVYDNLRYPQMRWDGRRVLYYIDPVDGQFVQVVGKGYVYPDNISGPGY
jgi:hypothetical protein